MRRRGMISGLIAFTVIRAFGQSNPPASSAFEVASVRPSKATGGSGSVQFLPGGQRLVVTNVPLSGLVLTAWKLTDRQISASGPFPFERYDINAETDRPVSREQLLLMLQRLLVDRFHLVLRPEVKEFPVYALLPAENGPRLRTSEDAAPPFTFTVAGTADRGHLRLRHATLPEFAWALSRVNTLRDRIVIDKTLISGEYDFDLTFAPDGLEIYDPSTLPPPESIFKVIVKQLGLRLEPQIAAVGCLFIDHATKPERD
jgi:uncharacterized protein (TIGR03435 family)